MPERASWTLDELVERVSAALGSSGYPGSPNGRVRELPDRRAVRWYTTTGLVDRPLMQGRSASYGSRHLLQVVAVKRLQAQGLSLAEVQAKLSGATDELLRRLADVPEELAEPAAQPSTPARTDRGRFWAEPPPAAPVPNGGRTDSVQALTAVTLPGGAMLLLPPGTATSDIHGDINAIRAAATPLLELLADRGLLTLDDRSPS